MKRVLYSIPLFMLLLPWLFFSAVVLAVGLENPFALLLLLPTGLLLGGAFFVHRNRTKADQHGIAAIGASAILVAPIIALLVAFFSPTGMQMAVDQAREMNAVGEHDLQHHLANLAPPASRIEGCESEF